MPTKKKPAREAQRDLPSIPKELIDQFVSGPMDAVLEEVTAWQQRHAQKQAGILAA